MLEGTKKNKRNKVLDAVAETHHWKAAGFVFLVFPYMFVVFVCFYLQKPSLALAQFKKTNPLYPGYLPEAPDPRYHGPGPEEDTFCNISKGNYKEKHMFLHGW